VVVRDATRSVAPSDPGPGFDIVLNAGDAQRLVNVPAGFDAAELVRLIKVLEAAC
jgi:hypothetical protein